VNSKRSTPDVFLSYALADRDSATLLASAFTEAGLSVFDIRAMPKGEQWQNEIWDAIVSSQAFVALFSPGTASNSNILVELGAASAWQKPIYIVWAGTPPARLPGYLQQHQVYPLSRLDDVVRSIRRGVQRLSDEERSVLLDVYRSVRVPTDQLLRQPSAVERLTREFNRRSSKRLSGERLLQELIRLRKRGELPRTRVSA
jgi:hypothetical protein